MNKTYLSLNAAGFATTIPTLALLSREQGKTLIPFHDTAGLAVVALWLFIFGAICAQAALQLQSAKYEIVSYWLWTSGIYLVAQAVCYAVLPGPGYIFAFVTVPLAAIIVLNMITHAQAKRLRDKPPAK